MGQARELSPVSPLSKWRAVEVLPQQLLIVRWFLGLSGIYVTGSLTLSHLKNLELPCGTAQSGCDQIAASPMSSFLGLPVAAYGLCAYLLLSAIAAASLVRPEVPSSGRFRLGYLVSLAGFAGSLYFFYIAEFEMKATCPWCNFSALTMCLVLLSYAGLALLPPAAIGTRVSRAALIAGALSLAIFGGLRLGGFLHAKPLLRYNEVQFSKLDRTELVPKAAHEYGPKGAKNTILIFLDTGCTFCARAYRQAKHTVDTRSDVNLVVRNFPLNGGESMIGAVGGEIAARKGLLWKYLDLVFAKDKPLPPHKALIALGLPSAEVNDRVAAGLLNPPEDLKQDLKITAALDLQGTPFIVLIHGHAISPQLGTGIPEEFAN